MVFEQRPRRFFSDLARTQSRRESGFSGCKDVLRPVARSLGECRVEPRCWLLSEVVGRLGRLTEAAAARRSRAERVLYRQRFYSDAPPVKAGGSQ